MSVIENQQKIEYYKSVIKKTVLAIQRYKNQDIILAGELNSTLDFLNEIYKLVTSLSPGNDSTENKLIEIGKQLGSIIQNYGTDKIEDAILMVLGLNNIDQLRNLKKFELINEYIHPINVRVVNKTGLSSNSLNSEDNKLCELSNLNCLNLAEMNNKFQLMVYGLRVIINYGNRLLVINGITDDIGIMFIDNDFVISKYKELSNIKIDSSYTVGDYQRYIKTLSLKDFLIYSEQELVNNFIETIRIVSDINKTCLSNTIDKFVGSTLFEQRSMLSRLLMKDNSESKYLAYLLYDLLSNETNGIVDTFEQTLLYDSLPWILRKYFNEAMKQTVQYTNNLNSGSNNKLPLEQQICLLKASDSVKEKAMIKLKEIRNKSEDSGAKAKLFLDGLLRIPFGIYKEEDILKISKNNKNLLYNNINKLIRLFKININFNKEAIKNNYELDLTYRKLYDECVVNITNEKIDIFTKKLDGFKRPKLIKIVNNINGIIKRDSIKTPKLVQSGKNSKHIINSINDFIKKNENLCKKEFYLIQDVDFDQTEFDNMLSDRNKIITENNKIQNYMNEINKIMDDSVYGHTEAKRQIQRIVGQWINGEGSGYCFGFEGPPGVGKTSLAKKGLSKCLKDNDGVSRPFSFIAIGGSSNGSILEGHSYTYVGSTWGKIVDILIDSKCMNPIIFIDELDKISRTENGKEIIGILTHLIDTTQNDKFQDKYFSGIDLDLSKCLFVFSYNDVNLIDPILLDRIHRIKFNFLSLDDKLKITRKFILPEIYKKMGIENIIDISEETVQFIIDTYTNEAGVRKLKELIFEIMGEVNLEILKTNKDYELPIKITNEDIKNKYLKNHNFIINKYINNESKVGIINGLWANGVGNGGILPIEIVNYPSTSLLDLKLTGMQGDVMKESMNVAKTLACKLTDDDILEEYLSTIKKTNTQGIHIHCPEGATPKDGPSAGAAITVGIYSLLNNRKIKNNVAITGEINLQGMVTAIGGIDLKILGGIQAGIKTFIYPKDNEQDLSEFKNKTTNKSLFCDIDFISVDKIEDVINNIIV